MTYTPTQLAEAREAFRGVARYFHQHQTMPPNYLDVMGLPLEIASPETGATRIVLIGEMTPQDMQDWADNEYAKAIDRSLADLQDKEI